MRFHVSAKAAAPDRSFPPRGGRHVIVLAVAVLHALAIWLLTAHLSATSQSHVPDADTAAVTIILAKAKPSPEQNPPQATREAAKSIVKAVPKPTDAARQMREAEPISIAPPSPPSNDKPPRDAVPGLTQKALDSVGMVVGELRKDGTLPDISKLEIKPNRFEKAIASAARINETTTETFTGNDGHVITRVSGPDGTYCVMTTLDSDPDGMDRAQRGLAIKKVHCPH
jgi:hypothetical protein